MAEWRHKPGSDEALRLGCSCPVMDNSYGKGRYCDGEKYGWWITLSCVLHGRSEHQTQPTKTGVESGPLL